MIRNKAWRRYQDKVKEDSAYRKFIRYASYYSVVSKTKDECMAKARKDARLLRDNMKNCSCWMCRNETGLKPAYVAKLRIDQIEIDECFKDINQKD